MILALDIATRTGWAAGDALGPPVTGVIDLSKAEGIGGKMAAFVRRMDDLTTEYDFDLIVFEQPMQSFGRGSSKTLRLLLSLCSAAEMVSHWNQIPVREVPMQTWRKHFIGSGRAPKGEHPKWCKRQAQIRCSALGWGDLSDDEAEACGIWDYAMSLRRAA